MDFTVPAEHWVKLKENEKGDKYLDLYKTIEKLWNIKVMVIPIVTGALDTFTKGLIQRLEDLEISGQVETIQTPAFIQISQNTEESPGDLRRLAVTQIPVWNHQLTLMWKTRKGVNNNNQNFQVCIFNMNNLHTVIWHQIYLSNTNTFQFLIQIIWTHNELLALHSLTINIWLWVLFVFLYCYF